MSVTSYEIKKALAEKHRKDFFLTEVKSGSTWMSARGDLKILDGLAIRKSWTSPCFAGYEIKVSRSDFLRDVKFYTYETLCNELYIVCPKGMIDRTEVPETVGLMYYDPDKHTIITRKKAIYRKIEYTPDMLLYIIFSRLSSDRIPFFSDKAEYFQEYLQGKRDNRELGAKVKTKLIADNVRLEKELEELRAFKGHYETYKAIQGALHKHGIYGWHTTVADEVDKALSRKPSADVKDIRRDLERIVDRLQRMEAAAEETTDTQTEDTQC